METWKLICLGVVIHTVFFYSIFDIYFTSPIVHGMTPHKATVKPPAKRLVLFSADGLRADKMFELDQDGRTRIPYLRSIMEGSGAWGVSHTRVPTESRPGHVALIAGFYEDVSAVAKGWKENPVEFDSLFNESRYTWSWGSPDILPMFAQGASGDHVFTKCYPPHFEDFAGSEHHRLDTWVFDEVKEFFRSSEVDSELRDRLQEDRIVFFLHLLGIDTNGHSKKPFSKDYLENIRVVDEGIRELVDVVETFYQHDGQTAYIMSADHGMTDWGSHGAGHPSETLTPLVAWGSGIRGPRQDVQTQTDTFSEDWKLEHLRRSDVAQGDIAPLMSTLIGSNFPMNSVGVLPYDYLNVTDAELADMMYANTRQMLEQYQVKMELKRSTTLSIAFRPFKELTSVHLADSHRHIHRLLQNGQYKDVIAECERLMQTTLRGLNYYQTYDRLFLGVSVCCGFLGWMVYVLSIVLERHAGILRPSTHLDRQNVSWWARDRTVVMVFSGVATVIVALLYVQSLPWTNYLYCLIPVVLWMMVTLRRDILMQTCRYASIMGNRNSLLLALLVSLLGLEILVIGFFYRAMLSVGLALIAILPWLTTDMTLHRNKVQLGKPMLFWSLSCLFLAVFPLLPVVTGKRNTHIVLAGGLVLIASSIYRLLRSQSSMDSGRRDVVVTIFQHVALVVATYFSSYQVEYGLSMWQHGLSWAILVLMVVEPVLSSTQVNRRLHTLVLAVTAPFILLSVSYELLFLFSLVLLLYQWLQLECSVVQRSDKNMLETLDFRENVPLLDKKRAYLVAGDIQRAFFYVFIILTSFFGTGNIASINSFDPAAVLCFVSVFSPFVMGALLLFKVMVPFVLVTCVLRAVCVITGLPVDGLFLIILLMSDCMALHFFFLVQDYGSWLDIGTSISHYVIVMCMIIFSMVLYGLSHILTTYTVKRSTRKRRKD